MTILDGVEADARSWADGWLDSYDKAGLVVSRDLAVHWCSRAARRLLEGPGPLVLRAGQVAGADRQAHDRLARCVARSNASTAALALIDGGAHSPAILLKARRMGEDTDEVALSLAEYGTALDLPDVAALFSVTPAEGDVVRMLVGGKSAVEIADQLDIAVLTVRTHIKRAYSKLGVHSKEQLFAKLSVLANI
jgi:DNA-binding CsgD family transcriptional regulator